MLNLPVVIQLLLLANILVQLLQSFIFSQLQMYHFISRFGFVSARYTGDIPFSWEAAIAPVSYMFIHGGWLHLAINMAMLAAFGSGVIRALGNRKAVVLYLLCGVFSAIFHTLFYLHTQSVLIGASGGVSGLFGAVIMVIYNRGGFGSGFKKLLPVIVLWVLMAVFFGFMDVTPGAEGENIAWTAHIGGFFAGMALYPLFVSKKPKIKIVSDD